MDVFVSTHTSLGLIGKQFYLIHRGDAWFITNEMHLTDQSLPSGFIRFGSKGKCFSTKQAEKIDSQSVNMPDSIKQIIEPFRDESP